MVRRAFNSNKYHSYQYCKYNGLYVCVNQTTLALVDCLAVHYLWFIFCYGINSIIHSYGHKLKETSYQKCVRKVEKNESNSMCVPINFRYFMGLTSYRQDYRDLGTDRIGGATNSKGVLSLLRGFLSFFISEIFPNNAYYTVFIISYIAQQIPYH